MYFSLFGKDLAAGQTARARLRFVLGHNVPHKQAVSLYEAFLKEKAQ